MKQKYWKALYGLFVSANVGIGLGVLVLMILYAPSAARRRVVCLRNYRVDFPRDHLVGQGERMVTHG